VRTQDVMPFGGGEQGDAPRSRVRRGRLTKGRPKNNFPVSNLFVPTTLCCRPTKSGGCFSAAPNA
jgi:hypothetical protein